MALASARITRITASDGGYHARELKKVIEQRDAAQQQIRDLSAAESPAQYWKGLAQDTQKQLAQTQDRLTALSGQLDDLRKRVDTMKAARDHALERLNAAQGQLIQVSADRDDLASRLVTQESIKRRLWEVFSDL